MINIIDTDIDHPKKYFSCKKWTYKLKQGGKWKLVSFDTIDHADGNKWQ